MSLIETAWSKVGEAIKSITGRKLVGTDGGLYVFSDTEIRVPDYDVEAAVHELCHWIVASDRERRMPNLDMYTDPRHPDYARMVLREESAWSLEFWLFGDPTPVQLARIMSPVAMASGSGQAIGQVALERIINASLEEDAKAEILAASRLHLSPIEIRARVVRQAAKHGLDADVLMEVIQGLVTDEAQPQIESGDDDDGLIEIVFDVEDDR